MWRLRHGADTDWVDRANGQWSVLLLSVLAVASFLLRLTSDPVTCWPPAHFPPHHVTYSAKLAEVQGMYLSAGELRAVVRSHTMPSYHLTVPLILFMQAVGFFAPSLIWRLLRGHLSLDLTSLTSALKTSVTQGTSGSSAMFRQSASLLLEALGGSRCLLTVGFLTTKLLRCLNLLAQFVALSVVFHSRLGFRPVEPDNVAYFPLTIVFDYDIMQLQNVARYSIQCILSINDVYVRMFVFLWYWILFLLVLTLFNTILTAATALLPALRDRPLVVYVRAGGYGTPGEGSSTRGGQDGPRGATGVKPSPCDVKRWAGCTLGADGALLLSLTASAHGPLLAAGLAQEMWALTQGTGSHAGHGGPQGHYPTAQGVSAPPQGAYPSLQGFGGVTAPPPSSYSGPVPASLARGGGVDVRARGVQATPMEMKPLM